MFAPWETFYLMIGTSAAALVGVMFIVITLAAEIAADQINRGTTVYQTPIVFHLAAIVTASALTLVPEHLLPVVGIGLAIVGIAGFIYAAVTTMWTFQPYEFYTATPTDKLLFGILPSVLYAIIVAGAVAVFLAPNVAAEVIGAATLVLLLVSIRNAWDIATFSVRVARSIAAKTPSPK